MESVGKAKDTKDVNIQKYIFATPTPLGPTTLRLERTVTSHYSGSGSVGLDLPQVQRSLEESRNLKP